jgi:hypothetical protein
VQIAGLQRQGLDRVSLRAARPACRLPSQGLLVFTGLWGASLAFLAANTFLVWQLVASYDAGAAAAGQQRQQQQQQQQQAKKAQ